jgi:polar amino acid transport system substrate-binding protein
MPSAGSDTPPLQRCPVRLWGAACIALVVYALCFCAPPEVARADSLEKIHQRGSLIWGADQEGGGPFVYPDPQRDGRVIGFEVDLADLIVRHLGVRAEFFQGDWDTLPQFLKGGQIDIIMNGYEWTPQRAAQMQASRPYYIYELQLLAREGDERIQSWDDLKSQRAGPWVVGVLEGSAAASYMREHFPAIELRPYDGNTNAMAQVRSGIDSATLQDGPIAVFYRDKPQGEGLRFVGEAVAPGHYVIYARFGEDRLIRKINEAIDQALLSGELRRIYEKWNLWNSTQERLASAAATPSDGKAIAGWDVVRRYAGTLRRAAGMTMILAVTAMPLAIIAGLLIALGRLYGPALVRIPLTVYVEVLRGTPIMLQLFVLFFVLPSLLPPTVREWSVVAAVLNHWSIAAAILGLAINYSAYEAEIYRAGLQAIPAGQMDAALALGMSRGTALRRVIVPQAVRIVIPPVTNDFIALFKDTSICSVVAVTELTKQYNVLANSTGAVLELAAMTALLYMIMSYPLSLLARRMEAHLSKPGR